MKSDRDIGVRIKRIRERQGMTQAELADHCEITIATISRIENGNRSPRADTVRRIAQALGVSLDVLVMGAAENMPRETSQLSIKERQVIAAWREGDRIEAVRIILSEESGSIKEDFQ